MHFRMKVQPVNADGVAEEPPAMRQNPKSRLLRLFERPFSLKNFAGGDSSPSRDNFGEFEPRSVCLRKMVQKYIEDPDSENQSRFADSSDEEDEYSCKLLRTLKSLVRCANVPERDLMTSAVEIVENANMYKPEGESRLNIIADELVALGYDAAICKSRWKKTKTKSCTCPAGEYEYLDVMIGGERVLIDIDFQSKFEIARPTKTYKKISQTLPHIFVGQVDRLKKIVIVASKAAKQSMKKKGLLMPPWRRPEFVLTKWVSPHVRGNLVQGEPNGNGSVGNGGVLTSL